MSDQSPESRPRRRVVRRAAAPPPAAPPAPSVPVDAEVAEAPTTTAPERTSDVEPARESAGIEPAEGAEPAEVTPSAEGAQPAEGTEPEGTDADEDEEAAEAEAAAGSEGDEPTTDPTLDIAAELSQLAAAPRRRATRKKAAPVSAVQIVLPGDEPEPAAAGDAEESSAASEGASDETGAPAKKAAKKTARRSAAKKAAEQPPTRADGAAGEAAGTGEAESTADAEGADEPAKAPARKRGSRRSTRAADAPEARGSSASQEKAEDSQAGKAAGDEQPGDKQSADKQSADKQSGDKKDAEKRTSPRLATTAVLFQAPDPSLAKPKRRRATAEAGSPQGVREQLETDEDAAEEVAEEATPKKRSRSRSRKPAEDAPSTGPEDEESSAALDDDQDSNEQDTEDQDSDDQDSDQDSDEGGSRSARRRRRRGGRGRRGRGSGEDSAQDSAQDSDDDATEGTESPSGDDESEDESEGGGSSRRRRRRRSRSGRGNGDAETSSRSDEVTALRGSTRLEAKRQRRREGRDAGRRRQILTEAEFLARRESVERTMVVRESNGRTQIAVLEDGVLAEHYVSRATQTSMVGNVYLGRVQNVLPSMEAAFVDVGKGRNAVLYAGEVNWDAAGLEGQPRRIETALKSGDSVLVQVTKDPIGHKGARLTSQVTLAGRYLVFVPGAGMTGISRKLPEKERARLKKLLREIVPESSGVIVRTAAEGASEEELRADIARLTEQWAKIEKKAKTASAPALLQGEADLAIRVVRDIFNDDFSSLVVQGKEAWDTISGYVKELAPDLSSKLSRWTSEKDVFAEHRIDEQIAKAMDRKVWLPSGGSLVIDRTEAMTVIDVNTGKFTGTGGTLEETVTRNNLEAAEEIVRQLRLRDIGGIIVIDFIDMVLESNRDLVLRRLVECLGRDRTKHQVAEVTSLGLVQMTRKRVGQGLLEAFSETCDHCGGRGYLVHDHPVDRGGQPQEQGEPKKSRRSRKQAAAKETPVPAVPVLPAERDKVNATLAAIAAAAAHAHEAEDGEKDSDAQGPDAQGSDGAGSKDSAVPPRAEDAVVGEGPDGPADGASPAPEDEGPAETVDEPAGPVAEQAEEPTEEPTEGA